MSTSFRSVPLIGLKQYNFHSEDVDWVGLNESLSLVDWDKEFNNLSVDEITEKFLTISLNIVEQSHVPLQASCNKAQKNKITLHRRGLMTKRRTQRRLTSAKLRNGKKEEAEENTC